MTITTRTQRLLCSALLLSVCTVGAIEAQASHLEALISVEQEALRVVQHTVRSGELPRAAQLKIQAGDWVIQAFDSSGHLRAIDTFPDPRLRYQDDFITTSGKLGMVQGRAIHALRATFAVRLPTDPLPTHLELARIMRTLQTLPNPDAAIASGWTIPQDALESIGRLPLSAIPTGQAAGVAGQGRTIVHNGPSNNRIDVVFLAEGYTTAEQGQFDQDVQLVIQHLLGEEPLRSYQAFFNFHRVWLESRESGIDRPDEGIFKETALEMGYGVEGFAKCIDTGDERLVFDAAAQAPEPANVILVLVNDARLGGCTHAGSSLTPSYATASMRVPMSSEGLPGPAIAAHEFGHAFGNLADEHMIFQMGRYNGPEPSWPNVTIATATARDQIKWKAWIDSATPLPTFCNSPAVGLFEGAVGYEQGLFRPTCTSKMNGIFYPWREVNTEWLIKSIYAAVNPIETRAPEQSFQLVEVDGAPMSFNVSLLEPDTSRLQVRWELNGVMMESEGRGFTLDVKTLKPGRLGNRLRVIAEDPTSMVRNRATGPFPQGEFSWYIQIQNRPPVLSPIDDQAATTDHVLSVPIPASDVDGDDLTITVDGQASGGQVVILGDVNADERVSAADLTALRSLVGSSVTSVALARADLDRDGRITQADETLLVSLVFGGGTSTRAFAWVPSSGQQGQHAMTIHVDDGRFGVIEESFTVTVTPHGDLNRDGVVKMDELMSAVLFALGEATPSAQERMSLDRNTDTHISIDELTLAVNNALAGPDARQIDGNANGVVESAEWQALMSRPRTSQPLTIAFIVPRSYTHVGPAGVRFFTVIRGTSRKPLTRAYLNGRPLLTHVWEGTSHPTPPFSYYGFIRQEQLRPGRNTLTVKTSDHLRRIAETSLILWR